MSYISNKIYHKIKNRKDALKDLPVMPHLSSKAIQWSLTHGESDHMKGRSLAVDDIHNVIEFLEHLENDDIPELDFLELRACDQGCAGGALLQGNRFLTVERLKIRAKQLEDEGGEVDITKHKEILQDKDLFISKIDPLRITSYNVCYTKLLRADLSLK